MTRRDALALIRALREKEPERPSVEISRNSKGVVISVKVSARSVKDAGRKAQAEYDRLAKLYPQTNGGDE